MIKKVEDYVYLGHKIKLGRESLDGEINRRIQLTWAAFGKLDHVFCVKISQYLKTRVYNQCVLPIMIYACESWTLTAGFIYRLKVKGKVLMIFKKESRSLTPCH